MLYFEALAITVFAAIFGSLFGSFINVVAIRVHEASSITGRSRCMDCKKPLKARHLVPVLSWLIQRGKCAYCGRPINIQYPLVEVAGALLAVITALRYYPDPQYLWIAFEFFFGITLLIFIVMDIRWMELPVELMAATGVVFTLWHMLLRVAAGEPPVLVFWSHALGFVAASLFFLFQWVVSRGRWIGAGDIWLGALIGAALGWPMAGLAVYFAYIFGGGTALILLIAKKLKPGMRVPFAPALIAGTLAAIWWAAPVLSWLSNALS
ncbi:MAG: prepilin peptidase [Patescibacteria group bacterium]